ncbi:MAG: hypothetical protein ACE5GQ_04630 [Nitrospinales bacterium]
MNRCGKKKAAVRAFVLFFTFTFMFAVSAGIVAAKENDADELAEKIAKHQAKKNKEIAKVNAKKIKLEAKEAAKIAKGKTKDAAKIAEKIVKIMEKLDAKLAKYDAKVASPSH